MDERTEIIQKSLNEKMDKLKKLNVEGKISQERINELEVMCEFAIFIGSIMENIVKTIDDL